MGEDSNNAAELRALETGLRIAIRQGFSKLIVEGDSQLIIQMLKNLQYSSSPAKISNNWQLTA